MKMTYALATAVIGAGMIVVTEIVPLSSERAHAACQSSPCPAIVPVERHHGFTDVGSHGPGFEFVSRGPIRVITPVS